MKMQQTVAGVTLRRSLGFWVGQLGDVPIMARKYNRGLYRWSVQRYQRSELLGKGVTLTEALQAARDWLAKQGDASRNVIDGYNVEFQAARPAKAGEDY